MQISITTDEDIIKARSSARELLKEFYFSNTLTAFVLTSISEVARNILQYAGRGVLNLNHITVDDVTGIEITAHDQGPGIENIEEAMRDGFSTSHSLGLGLPGVRRMMDEFEIESTLGKGTRVRFVKWRKMQL